jgi:hypothetical protein
MLVLISMLVWLALAAGLGTEWPMGGVGCHDDFRPFGVRLVG